MVGSFDKSGISFGEGDEHTSLGESDVFVARFTTDGKLEWAHTYGAEREDIGWGVASTRAGNTRRRRAGSRARSISARAR